MEGDFRRMNFEREIHFFFFKHVKDWQPAFRKIGVTFVEKTLARRRKRINRVPDAGTGEAIDYGGIIF